MSETLCMELCAIDWDEALVWNALVGFDRRRSDAIHRDWPIGARVRWLQTPNREAFEAEGVIPVRELERIDEGKPASEEMGHG